MCVIYANYTAFPNLEELKRGEDRNADGAGMAWIEEGKVLWEKGLDAQDVHNILKSVKLPNVVHFRLASIGPAIPPLTHPFPLTPKVPLFLKGQAASVLVHNGTVHNWRTLLSEASMKSRRKLPGGEWSDSRAIAWLVANFGEGILTAKDLDLVMGQRIAILSSDGTLKRWGPSWPASDFGKGYHQSVPTYGMKKGKNSSLAVGASGYNTSAYSYGGDWPDYRREHTTPLLTDGVLSAQKVPHLGSGTSYHFDPVHERKLAPIRHVFTSEPALPPCPTKVTVIKDVKKIPEAAKVPSQVLYTKPELEKVLAAIALRQEVLASQKQNVIIFPRKGTSH